MTNDFQTLVRRDFLRTTAATTAAVVAVTPRFRHTHQLRQVVAGAVPTGVTTLRDPRVKTLALQALDVARGAGASYADVRVTSTTERIYVDGPHSAPGEKVRLGFGVRVLVQGYWGWAATPYVLSAEATRVARTAVRLAQANAAGGRSRPVDLGQIPVVQDGEWTTPIHSDPLEVPVEEVMDWVRGTALSITDMTGDRSAHGPHQDDPQDRWNGGGGGVHFFKQERVFASSEGSYLTQAVYVTSPGLSLTYRGVVNPIPLPPAQAGWEYLTTLPLADIVAREIVRIDAEKTDSLPIIPAADIGRYDVVFSASAMGNLLNQTIGYATQLSRALGYEANGTGTSYLGPDPLQWLGKPVAAPLVTVTTDRSASKALATVKWDDEGVVPEDFTLIKDGVLVDYQTTREQAAWLAPWYARQGQPVRSHGCAETPTALSYTMQHTPNLTLQPGAAALGVAELVKDLTRGLLVETLHVDVDFQHLNGLGTSQRVFVVRNGKRVAQIDPRQKTTIMFRAPEFWKSVRALGGPASQLTLLPAESVLGFPPQATRCSIAAVPALVEQVAVVRS